MPRCTKERSPWPNAAAAVQPPPPLPRDASLFLDVDGTLIEIADTPDSVEIPPHLPAMLRGLSRQLNGRLAIVSGRSVDTLRQLGFTGIAAAGSHGLEITLANRWLCQPERPAGMDTIVTTLRHFAHAIPRVLVEEKPLSVGLHFRLAPDREEACRLMAQQLAAEHGLSVQSGKMLYEIKASGADKGSAIQYLMRQKPFADGTPVFAGDDATDEDGFIAVNALGGFGIQVGAARRSAARYWLCDVQTMRNWLNDGQEQTRTGRK